MPDSERLDNLYPRLDSGFPDGLKAWAITADFPGCIHRFHHTSPLSPSGRYLAVTRLPREDKRRFAWENADIVLIDLDTGSGRIIARTRAWDTQLGAQVQWGRNDEELLYNSWDPKVPGKVACIVYNLLSGKSRRLDGPLYVAHAGKGMIASNCLRRIGRTQVGYGAILPRWLMPKNRGAPADDGVYLTSLESGNTRMLSSWMEVTQQCNLEEWVSRSKGVYGFHLQWNPQGSHLLLVLRRLNRKGQREPILCCLNVESGQSTLLIPPGAWKGNHPCWMPDGEHILMNLDTGDGLKFQKIARDGAYITPLSHHAANKGHPSIHPDGRYLLTDDYARNDPSGEAPLIALDLHAQKIRTITKINAQTIFLSSRRGKRQTAMRLDLHPAWHQDGKWITFNAIVNDSRCVCLLDASQFSVLFDN